MYTSRNKNYSIQPRLLLSPALGPCDTVNYTTDDSVQPDACFKTYFSQSIDYRIDLRLTVAGTIENLKRLIFAQTVARKRVILPHPATAFPTSPWLSVQNLDVGVAPKLVLARCDDGRSVGRVPEQPSV